jgi:transcriptional regulator of NAD metabolism
VPGADGGRPCGGCDSDVRVTRAVAATLLAEGLAAALSPEESRSYVRRLTRAQAAAHGHPVDGEVPRG